MTEFANPSYFPPGSGGATSGEPVANLSARLALSLADAKGKIFTQNSDGSSWVLKHNGNPANAGDWLAVSPAAGIGHGVPVNGETATLTTGSGDHALKWDAAAEGAAGNSITVAIAAVAPLGYTTPVILSGTAITVTPGAKANLVINFNVGSVLVSYLMMTNGRPHFRSPLDVTDEVKWQGSKWQAAILGAGTWESSEDVATPDLVSSWTKTGATVHDLASINLYTSTASQVLASAAGLASLVLCELAPGSDGDASVVAAAAASLSGGVDSTPGMIRVTDSKIYAKCPDGLWREADLATLSS